MATIEVTGLRKSYGSREVLHGLDFTVEQGEVFALLGPNGAGKTTTVEILEGYRGRDGGAARVLGCDPGTPARAFGRESASSCSPQPSTPRSLCGRCSSCSPATTRAPGPAEVIALVGLEESASPRRGLSGGQLRRLDLGLALVGDPELVFLDEPTTGFDPEARRRAWDTVLGLRDLGKTVLLTTHYLEEAQRLADRVAILRDGRIAATAAPQELLSANGSVEIRFRAPASWSSFTPTSRPGCSTR